MHDSTCVEVVPRVIGKIAEAFPFDHFYCPPLESLIIESGRPLRGHFNLIHHETGLRADIYTVGEDPLHHWAMANRRAFEIEGERVWLAPPEYVILRKLQFYREGGSDKHLRDIAGILEMLSDSLDNDWLLKNVHDYGLAGEWKKAEERVKY